MNPDRSFSDACLISDPPIRSLHVDHVCFGIEDLDGMIAWYRQMPGFSLEIHWPLPDMYGYELAYMVGPDGFGSNSSEAANVSAARTRKP